MVTSPSPFLAKAFQDLRGDIQILPNPLILDSYSEPLPSRSKMRIIWIRAYQQLYDPWLAVYTFEWIRKKLPDVSMTMIGPVKDQSYRDIKDYLSKSDIKGIETLGKVPKTEIASWMGKGSVFLNTSQIDNSPVTLMEAMASGLPVVSTQVGGIPDLFGSVVLLCPSTPNDLGQAILSLLQSEQKWGSLIESL